MHPVLRRTAVACCAVVLLWTAAERLPPLGATTSYAGRIRELSEPEGWFDTDNLISNEGSYLDVVPALIAGGVNGGAYIGVGPEQNFSYISRVRPAVAYIVDIRRDNLLLHLLFKALFAQAGTRLEYLSLLTGRTPPPAAEPYQQATLADIVQAVEKAERAPREASHQQLEQRIRAFGVPLSPRDLETIERFHRVFATAGFTLRFQSHGRPPREFYPTLRELLLASDSSGRQWSYLASEEDYRFVRALQERDAIVPVIGNLSGPHALRAIGAALAASGEPLSALYVSNVEDYLFRDGSFVRFADNLGRLPRTPRSVVIRSIFRGGPSISMIQRLDEMMSGISQGHYRNYFDLTHPGYR